MAWVPYAVMGASSVLGAMSSNKNSKAQGKMMEQEMAQRRAELAFRQGLYQRYLSLYGPMEEKMTKDLSGDKPMGWGLVSSDINRRFDEAERNFTNSMGNGTRPAFLSRGLALQKDQALASAYQKGLLDTENARMHAVQSSPLLAAAAGVSNANNGLAGTYDSFGRMYGAAAAQGANAMSQGLQGIAQYYGYMNPPQSSTAGFKPINMSNPAMPNESSPAIPSGDPNIPTGLMTAPSPSMRPAPLDYQQAFLPPSLGGQWSPQTAPQTNGLWNLAQSRIGGGDR